LLKFAALMHCDYLEAAERPKSTSMMADCIHCPCRCRRLDRSSRVILSMLVLWLQSWLKVLGAWRRHTIQNG